MTQPPRLAAAWRHVVPALGFLAIAAGFGSPALAAAPGAIDPPALAGVTVDLEGRVLPGVEIRVTPWSTSPAAIAEVLSTRTDGDGRFAFDELPRGDYRLIAIKGGYAVLVGKVSALAQETLQLILRPAGFAPAEPGVPPEGKRWTMRLPARDLLEDVEQSVTASLSLEPGPTARREHAAVVEIAAGPLEDAGGSGFGLAAHLGGDFDLAGGGALGVDYRRLSNAGRDDWTGRLDQLDLDWTAPFRTPLGSLRFALQGTHGERRGLVGELGALDSGFDALRLRGSSQLVGERSLLALDFAADGLRGDEAIASASTALPRVPFEATRAVLGAEWNVTHGRHAVDLVARARTVDPRVGDGRRDAGFVVLTPWAVSTAQPTLQSLGASGGTLELVDRARVSERTTVIGRVLGSASDGPWGATLGAATVGASWDFLPGLALRAEAGASWGGPQAAAPIWIVSIGGRGEGYAWSLERAVEEGLAPWSRTGRGAAPRVVASERDMSSQRWSARGEWSPGTGGVSVLVGLDLYQVEGTLAAVLPSDLLLVPAVADASLSGERALLAVHWARLGSVLELEWNSLDDEQEGLVLLGGADAFQHGTVQVRQRVLSSETWGATASVLVGYEAARFRTEPTTVRAALTERSRFSGGLAVSF